MSTQKNPKQKIAFVRHAAHAQRVEDDPQITTIASLVKSSENSPQQSPSSKIGIPHEYLPPGRPKNAKTLSLPPGYHGLRSGRATYSDEFAEEYLNAYYECGGSVTRACRKTNTRFQAVNEWIAKYPEFASAIKEVDQILKDEIHSQFMTRVLNEWEPNPAWKFKYFNKHFPEYSEIKKSMKVSFSLKDTLIKPEIIEGEVVKSGTGPQQLMEAPPDTR